MLFSVIAFNQLKSSNSRQGGSLDGIVSFFEPFLNNQVKWSVCINNDFISSLTRKWPLPLGAVCWQCSMTWSPEPLWHSSSLALVTRWDAYTEGLLPSLWSYQHSLQISEILETQTVAGVWSFLTDPDFGMLMIFRITIVALSFAVGFPLLALKGPIGSDLIEAISPWLQWHLFIFLFYLYFV